MYKHRYLHTQGSRVVQIAGHNSRSSQRVAPPVEFKEEEMAAWTQG